MSTEKSEKKYLLIFDFDETIIDQDSEEELLKNIFSKEEYDKINKDLVNMEFFEGFNYYFKRMKQLGKTLNDLNGILEKIQLSPKMEELFDYLRKNKSKYEIIICSNAIDYEIKYILKYKGILDLFDGFICTKAIIQNEKSDTLLLIPKNQFPHTCDKCPPSQCKGFELRKYIEKSEKQFEKIIFVCDGSNDFCPSKNTLKKGDIAFPRKDHSLYKKLFQEKLRDQLVCEVYPWKNAEEIISKLKEL
jgi:2,3-diketo-5-methylthio-1-phosphopentane phosphatase